MSRRAAAATSPLRGGSRRVQPRARSAPTRARSASSIERTRARTTASLQVADFAHPPVGTLAREREGDARLPRGAAPLAVAPICDRDGAAVGARGQGRLADDEAHGLPRAEHPPEKQAQLIGAVVAVADV